MPTCAPHRVRGDVVRRFVAAATSLSDRIGLRRTVGGGRETSGRRRGRAGTAAAAPGPRPTVLRSTPNTRSLALEFAIFQFFWWHYTDIDIYMTSERTLRHAAIQLAVCVNCTQCVTWLQTDDVDDKLSAHSFALNTSVSSRPTSTLSVLSPFLFGSIVVNNHSFCYFTVYV